jgi:hypothetical protein
VGQFAKAIYNGATTIGGPAIRVNPSSSNAAAFLVAALYFPSLERISIVWYNGESNQELGTVLASVNLALAVDDVLEIKSLPRVLGVIQYAVYVNDVEVIAPIGDEDIPEDASCATFWSITGIEVVEEPILRGVQPILRGTEPLVRRSLE